MTSNAIAESNPVVGSSRKMTDGRLTISTAIERRFSWPPEIPREEGEPTGVARWEVRPRREAMREHRAVLFSFVLGGGEGRRCENELN